MGNSNKNLQHCPMPWKNLQKKIKLLMTNGYQDQRFNSLKFHEMGRTDKMTYIQRD